MARHLPSVTWSLRRYRDGQYPRIYVQTAPGSRVEIAIYDGSPMGQAISLPRADARLLARRINECLEASK